MNRNAAGAFDTVRSRDGTAIAFERHGEGPTLIVVGGAFNHRATAAPLAARLARAFTVVTYDRRGRGDSGDTPPHAPEREVEDLRALVDATAGGTFLYGHSSGAALALLAVAEGLPVVRLAAYEPPYVPEGTRAGAVPGLGACVAAHVDAGRRGEAVALFLEKAVGVPPDAIAGMRASPAWPGLEALAHTLPYDLALMGDGTVPAARLAAIEAPTLLLDGAASPPSLRHGVTAAAEAVPGARQRTLEGQTHDVDPDVLAPVLEAFFAGADPAATAGAFPDEGAWDAAAPTPADTASQAPGERR